MSELLEFTRECFCSLVSVEIFMQISSQVDLTIRRGQRSNLAFCSGVTIPSTVSDQGNFKFVLVLKLTLFSCFAFVKYFVFLCRQSNKCLDMLVSTALLDPALIY